MNYLASIADFFKYPKWTMNMLLGGVCCLIPAVGPMVYMGWLITGTWCRKDERYETSPDFDFNKFGKYLERGLWPMLVGRARAGPGICQKKVTNRNWESFTVGIVERSIP